MRVLAAAILAAALLACSGEQEQEPDRAPEQRPSATATQPKAAQPAQPATGYGGSDYPHRSVRRIEVAVARGAVTVFQPADPAPKEAPVVVQLQVGSPDGYLGWIEHAVRRGSIVVYLDSPLTGTTDAERIGGPVTGYRAAVRALQGSSVRPRWDRAVFVGHSIGGVMVSRIAAVAGSRDLPVPKAILAVQPPVADPQDRRPLRTVPPDVRLVVLASDQDDRVGTEGAEDLWQALGRLRTKQYVFVRSDDHGEPALTASHLFPLSGPGEDPDALDHSRLWPVLDALQDCVATGRGCGLPAVSARWSDGTAVSAQDVRDSP